MRVAFLSSAPRMTLLHYCLLGKDLAAFQSSDAVKANSFSTICQPFVVPVKQYESQRTLRHGDRSTDRRSSGKVREVVSRRNDTCPVCQDDDPYFWGLSIRTVLNSAASWPAHSTDNTRSPSQVLCSTYHAHPLNLFPWLDTESFPGPWHLESWLHPLSGTSSSLCRLPHILMDLKGVQPCLVLAFQRYFLRPRPLTYTIGDA